MPLTPEQFRRCEELFFELRQLPLNQRQTELALRCSDDPSVCAEVSALLRQDADSRGMNVSQFGGQVGLAVMEQVAFDTGALVGQRVGSYEIIDVIGQGGMGVIYLGRDVRLDRRAALKAVLPGPGNEPARVERLRREARLLASLSHPNIATVYGLEESDNTLLLAMEFIDGKTLSQRLGRHALPLPESLAVCEKIAAALEAAHDAGVIHRDLKPGNVMFTADGQVKVLDFGLAREVRRSSSDASPAGDSQMPLTRQGSFFGTPAYMSPEQARGETLDQRSDVFSFGCVLFRCLAGRPAFDGEGDTELVEAILTQEPQWDLLPDETPASIRTLLRRCLSKSAADRYRHIGDVRLEIRDALADRAWECADDEAAPGTLRRVLPWAIGAILAIAAFFGGMLMKPSPSLVAPSAAAAQRFDLTLPDDHTQKDLERIQLSIAPDGSYIMLACQTATGQELWIRRHDDGQWHRIPGTQGAHRPFLSPDGNWYGFYRDGHLFKRRLVGGEPIRLAAMTNWYGGAWTSDGGIIYSPGWGGPLALLHDASTPPRIVTRIDADQNEGSHVSPLILPGDKWLLYNVWTGGEECSIHATDLNTGAEHLVIHNASTPRLGATPRGNYLLFERASMIFAAPFDPATALTRGNEAAIAEAVMNDGTRFVAYFDVAADGTIVYFPGASFAEESRLAFVNPDGTTTPLNDDRLSFAEPRFSPDGNLLAVSIKGKLYRTLIYDLMRQTRQYLITNGDTVAQAISPDGRTIACTVNRDGGYGIDLISLADGTYRRIAQPGPDYQSDLDWSADGQFIAFTTSPREGVPRDVYIVSAVDPKEPTSLVTTAGEDRHGAISPDNKWLAYSSNVSGRFEIYIVAFPRGDRVRQISLGGGEEPAWSGDGKQLHFISPQGLMSITISGGAAAGRAEIVYDKPFGQSDPIARNYTVAPDGRILVVEPSERRPTVSHLQVISNWPALLPRAP